MRSITLGVAAWLSVAAIVCLAVAPFFANYQDWHIALVILGSALALTVIGALVSCSQVVVGLIRGDHHTAAKAGMTFVANAMVFLVATASWNILSPPYENAPRTISLNNIKQLAIAVQTYSQDNNDTLPGWVQNPDGRYAHNTWDEQINSEVKAKDAYMGRQKGGLGIRSSSHGAGHNRVLGYGLNGLLITPSKPAFDGNAAFDSVNAKNPPAPRSPGAIVNPSGTILFAELSTKAPMPVQYGRASSPKPYTWTDGESTSEWRKALDGWIDISPRDFIEVYRGAGGNSYKEPYGRNADCGIARDLYVGGGVYAFADGHAQFLKIAKTVGLGTTVNGKTVTEQNCWEPWNTNNKWIPR